jgi:hypothetical protein
VIAQQQQEIDALAAWIAALEGERAEAQPVAPPAKVET